LAAAASISRGAVRRYRKILRIPEDLQKRLLKELEDPDREDFLSVDQVIEAVDASESLSAAKILNTRQERQLIDSMVRKFKTKIIRSTVEPRKVGAIGRFVRNGDITIEAAQKEVLRFIKEPSRTIPELVAATSEDVESQKSLDRGLRTFEEKWVTNLQAHKHLIPKFKKRIQELIARLEALI
jgi:ParB family transcriptional regulator, chromosome partitioning protein